MNRKVITAIAGLVLTLAWFWVMSGPQACVKAELPEGKNRPLNERFLGYSSKDVAEYWGAFNDQAFSCETRFLKLDLAFPVLYGPFLASLAVAIASETPGGLVFAPAGVAAIADWTENLTHLYQLEQFQREGAVNSRWIRVASNATRLKWLAIAIAVAVALCAIRIFLRASQSVPMASGNKLTRLGRDRGSFSCSGRRDD